MYITVDFSPEELKEIVRVAELRNKPKMEAGIQSNLFGKHVMDEATSHFQGVMAEFAVAAFIDTDVDKTSRLNGDKGAPDLYKNAFSFEVKSTRLFHGDFIVPNPNPLKFVADIGVLCHPGNSNQVIISKWVTKQEFFDNHYLRNYGAGIRAAIKSSNMNDIGTLLTYIR